MELDQLSEKPIKVIAIGRKPNIPGRLSYNVKSSSMVSWRVTCDEGCTIEHGKCPVSADESFLWCSHDGGPTESVSVQHGTFYRANWHEIW